MMQTTEINGNEQESLDSEALLRETALKLRGLLRSVEQHGDGEHPSTIKDTARLSGAISGVCGELRQHVKARGRALAEFSLAEIVAHLRGLPKEQRDEAFTIAFGADASEPLL